jgi:hypothetical protein
MAAHALRRAHRAQRRARQLVAPTQETGALPFKTSASLLPDRPDHYERFQWLAQQVRDAGGEATLVRATEIEGETPDELTRQFNEARATRL